MADLSGDQASQDVNIVDPNNGNIVGVSSDGEMRVANFANIQFISAAKTVNTTASLLAVGGANLANRKSVVVFNRGTQDMYYGTAAVTDETNGIPIPKDSQAVFQVGENINIYIVTKTGTSDIIVQEFA